MQAIVLSRIAYFSRRRCKGLIMVQFMVSTSCEDKTVFLLRSCILTLKVAKKTLEFIIPILYISMRLVAANDKETVAGAEWISIYDHRLGQVCFRKSDTKFCAGLPDHVGENFDRLICCFWFMDAKVIATNAFLPVKAMHNV